jgi:hypothetical protein
LSGLHGGGTSSAVGNPTSLHPADNAAPFGPVPRPLLGQPLQAPAAGTGSFISYPGATTLVWAGNLTVTATALPVYRYVEPTGTEADRFAASIGALPSNDVAQGGIGVYAGRDFTLVVLSSVAQPPKEPYVNVSDLKSTVASGGDSIAIAKAYLDKHHLLPTWPYTTDVQTTAGTVRVDFLRIFDVPGLGQANLVDSGDNRYGTEVDLAPGAAGAFEKAPMPLTLEPATYPIISADQAIRALGASSSQSGASVPVVRITKAELVYTLVWGGDYGYYEPAFLFSGTFTLHGVASVKRILIPAVVPSLLTP